LQHFNDLAKQTHQLK